MRGSRWVATALAVMLVGAAYALLATPVDADGPHTFWYLDNEGGTPRINDTIGGGAPVSPDGGVTRFYRLLTSNEVNEDVNDNNGAPWDGMSDWIGLNGQAAASHMSSTQTGCGNAVSTSGDIFVHMMELDRNKATQPKVYWSNGVQISAAYPHGYVWAGEEPIIKPPSDQEVLPSGFYNMIELAAPVTTVGGPGTFNWAGLNATLPPTIASNPENEFMSVAVMEATADTGPWTQIGTVAFASGAAMANNLTIVAGRWYSALPIYKGILGGVRSLVQSIPKQPSSVFRIHVQLGWNLISMPLIKITNTLPVAFEDYDHDTLWDRAMWYNASDATDHWKQYNSNWSTSLNDLKNVNNRNGVWLNVTNVGDGFLNVTGLLPTATQISLRAGWNLVGYPTLCSNKTVANAFWGTGADIVEAFDQSATYKTKVVGPNYVMKPGEGYWVHVPADAIWTVDW